MLPQLFVKSIDSLLVIPPSARSEIDVLWPAIESRLNAIKPNINPFVTITKDDFENGDYIQCAGRKKRLTVEVRLYSPDRSFRHLVLGVGSFSGIEKEIVCSIGPIRVDSSQVLTIEDAKLIFRQFLEDGTIHPNYFAVDVTERFL